MVKNTDTTTPNRDDNFYNTPGNHISIPPDLLAEALEYVEKIKIWSYEDLLNVPLDESTNTNSLIAEFLNNLDRKPNSDYLKNSFTKNIQTISTVQTDNAITIKPLVINTKPTQYSNPNIEDLDGKHQHNIMVDDFLQALNAVPVGTYGSDFKDIVTIYKGSVFNQPVFLKEVKKSATINKQQFYEQMLYAISPYLALASLNQLNAQDEHMLLKLGINVRNLKPPDSPATEYPTKKRLKSILELYRIASNN